jgi:hypothetical protein
MKSQITDVDTLSPNDNVAPHWRATKLKFLAAVLVILATHSPAAAQAPDCGPGKLSDYEKLGPQGCMIGDKKFADFSYHQGLNGLPSSSISVTPGTVPDSDDSGILFEAKWAAPDSQESFVSYTLEVQPNGKPITGASLEMQFGEIAGTGEARVAAELCPESNSDACSDEDLSLNVILSASQPRKAVDKGQLKNPLTAVRVVTPLDIAPGSGGSASLYGFMMVFTQ